MVLGKRVIVINITTEFLKEVESNILACKFSSGHIVRYFDPLKRPKADELRNLFARLWSYCDKSDSLISEQAKEANKINKKSSSKVQLPLSSTGALQYMTHPQAVYTSRILDFKNLPEPKNADNNDDLLEMEYSDSLRVDFTKYDINSKDESN
ncbi:kinase-like domain-containing protein [Rhizophagus irregularis DAOM 181602=DAOM 197198]|nr:kinase-like domain-containing protein [Rhizophagus irregularis DAOM 181602=DAOM 197198]